MSNVSSEAKVYEFDSTKYVEVDRDAKIGDVVVILNNADGGFREGYVGVVSKYFEHNGSIFVDDTYYHDFGNYSVLEPVVEGAESPKTTDDKDALALIANLARRLTELERYTYEPTPIATTDEIDDAIAHYQESDNVNHPKHYNAGKYEVIDIIEDKVGDCTDGFEAACIANVLKYTMRYRHKNGVEDLRKAATYLGWAIERVEDREVK